MDITLHDNANDLLPRTGGNLFPEFPHHSRKIMAGSFAENIIFRSLIFTIDLGPDVSGLWIEQCLAATIIMIGANVYLAPSQSDQQKLDGI